MGMEGVARLVTSHRRYVPNKQHLKYAHELNMQNNLRSSEWHFTKRHHEPGPRLLPVCHSIMSHMLSQNPNLSHFLSHCHDLPLTSDASAPSRDIPLSVFVSAVITVTLMMIVIVTVFSSLITRASLSAIITLTLLSLQLAGNLGHKQKGCSKRL